MIILPALIALGVAVAIGRSELVQYRERRRSEVAFWEQVRNRPALYDWATDDGLWPW